MFASDLKASRAGVALMLAAVALGGSVAEVAPMHRAYQGSPWQKRQRCHKGTKAPWDSLADRRAARKTERKARKKGRAR